MFRAHDDDQDEAFEDASRIVKLMHHIIWSPEQHRLQAVMLFIGDAEYASYSAGLASEDNRIGKRDLWWTQ